MHHDAQSAQAFPRLAAELPFDPAKASDGLKDALSRSMGVKGFEDPCRADREEREGGAMPRIKRSFPR